MKGGIYLQITDIQCVSLFELLKTYSTLRQRASKQSIYLLPVFTAEEGAKQIKNNLQNIENWKFD